MQSGKALKVASMKFLVFKILLVHSRYLFVLLEGAVAAPEPRTLSTIYDLKTDWDVTVTGNGATVEL